MTDEQRAEVTVHALRLMRSGNYRSAKNVVRELVLVFPDIPESDIKDTLVSLAMRLIRSAT